MRVDVCALSCLLVLASRTQGQHAASYTVAFASFAPLNTDIFIAAGDGSGARPLLPLPASDYNASFSADGAWIIFTSERNGSADVYRVRVDGSGLKQLTNDPGFDDQGALSPDGTSLAFVSSRSGQADIWVLELATGALRNLTHHPAGDFRPAWSPDGRWIAFSTDRDSKKTKSGFVTLQSTEIHVVRVDGTGLRRVTHEDAVAGTPGWSHDGRQLIYYAATIEEGRKIESPRHLRGVTQIITIDFATNARAVMTTGPGEKWSPQSLADGRIGYVSGGPEGGVEFVAGETGARGEMRSPHWSADGKRMVFHRDVGRAWPPVVTWRSRDSRFHLLRTGVFPSAAPAGDQLVMNDQTAGILHNSILLMNSDGSNRSVLFTDSTRSALAPVWSQCGDRIAFGIGRFFQMTLGAALADVAVMNSDGTGFRVLTDGTSNYGLPSWSPEGRRLVYRAAQGNRNSLVIMDVASGVAKNILEGAAHYNFPSWSPAGDRIAFTSDRDADFEVYTIKPDGSGLTRLTTSPGNDAHNAFSPDGEWIAFTSARRGFKDEAALHPFNPQPYGDLYVMRKDGSDVRMLTDNQFEEGTPAWVPTRGRAASCGTK